MSGCADIRNRFHGFAAAAHFHFGYQNVLPTCRLVETASLASIPLPPVEVEHNLHELVEAGGLSDAQLETVVYATAKFRGPRLASGERAGCAVAAAAATRRAACSFRALPLTPARRPPPPAPRAQVLPGRRRRRGCAVVAAAAAARRAACSCCACP